MERFPDNIARLLGLHRLPANHAAAMMGDAGISQSVMSKWQSGARRPSFSSALAVGDFFQVPADRLARASFEDLLANELADPERFRAVEAKMHRMRTGLQVVPTGRKRVATSGLSDLTSRSETVGKRKSTKTPK